MRQHQAEGSHSAFAFPVPGTGPFLMIAAWLKTAVNFAGPDNGQPHHDS